MNYRVSMLAIAMELCGLFHCKRIVSNGPALSVLGQWGYVDQRNTGHDWPTNTLSAATLFSKQASHPSNNQAHTRLASAVRLQLGAWWYGCRLWTDALGSVVCKQGFRLCHGLFIFHRANCVIRGLLSKLLSM